MKWIKRLWQKCSTYFDCDLVKKAKEVYYNRETAVLFTLKDNNVEVEMYSEDHIQTGKLLGNLANRFDMDKVLVTTLQHKEYKDKAKLMDFTNGFSIGYKDDSVTAESAFLYMKGRSLR